MKQKYSMPPINFESKTGLFALACSGFQAQGGVLQLETDRFLLLSSELKWSGGRGKYFAEVSILSAKILWEIEISADGLCSRVKSLSASSLKLKILSLTFPWENFSPPLLAKDHFQLVNTAPISFPGGVHTVGKRSAHLPPENESATLTVFQNKKEKDALLLGAGSVADAATSFSLLHSQPNCDGSFGLRATFTFDSVLKEGETLSSPLLILLAGKEPLKLLEAYGEWWQKNSHFQSKPKVLGWNTFDYYGHSISEKDVLENMEAINGRTRIDKPCIIIDGGWECRWGDWEEANHHFPSGLKGLVRKIKQSGCIPGIWLAPFTPSVDSLFVRYHQNALLRNEKGELITKEYGVLLDPTHPEVEQYIKEAFTNLKKTGFSYFKIDFTSAIAEGRNFYDGKGSHSALRKGYQIIRDSIGEDSYLMICGCYSLETGAGIADGARVSCDIHNFWSHIKRNTKEISARYWLNGRIWNNDPDFLIVRAAATTDDSYLNPPYRPCPYDGEYSAKIAWLAGKENDLDEVITWASVVMLTAGEFVLSDNLARLNDKGWKIIAKVLENRLNRSACPLDLFSDEDVPSLWLGEEKEYYLLGVFNWEEKEKKITLDLASLGIKNIQKVLEVWSGTEEDTKELNFHLLPHQSRVFRIEKIVA